MKLEIGKKLCCGLVWKLKWEEGFRRPVSLSKLSESLVFSPPLEFFLWTNAGFAFIVLFSNCR